MTVTALGEVSLGEAVPLALASVRAQLTAILPQLEGLLAAQATLTVHPPTVATQLAAVAAIKAALEISPPSVGLQLTAVADLIAKLGALAADLNLQLAALGAGVSLYAYDGLAGGLGEFGTVTPGGTAGAHCNGLLICATDPAAWASVKLVLRTA